MSMWSMIPILLVVAFFIVLTWLQRRYQSSWKTGTGKDHPFLQSNTAALSGIDTAVSPDAMQKDAWWENLDSLHQLRLALYLAAKAIPVWEKFAAQQVVSYRTAPAGPITIIETSLLQKALEEIIFHAQLQFPDNDAIQINQYYKRFIGPVLALKDGFWICSYPAKKIFLSVYYILQVIVEQHRSATHENFLSEAINAALECMELSGLYTRKEIASFLSAYRSVVCL